MIKPFVRKTGAKPIPKLDSVGAILLRAADLLENEKWIRGSMGSPGSGMCMMGAIFFSLGKNERNGSAGFTAVDRLRVHLQPSDSVEHYNDHICPNKDHAVRKLREAAYVGSV